MNREKIATFLKRHKISLGLLGMLLIPFFLYHIYYSNRIIPGVFVGSVDLSALTFSEAKAKLTKAIAETNKNISLQQSDREFTITPEEIKLEYKINATLSRAFEVGRTGNIFIDNKDKIAGLIKTLQLKIFYDFDDAALSNKILSIRGEVDKPEINSSFKLNEKSLLITSSENGNIVDGQDLNKKVLNALDLMVFNPIIIPMEDTKPTVKEEDLNKIKTQTEKIVFKDFTIKFKDKSWKLSPEQILDLSEVVVSKDTNFEPELRLNKSSFEELVSSLGLEINTLPKAQVTEVKGNKVVSIKLLNKGSEIDEGVFATDFKKALFSNDVAVEIATIDIDENVDISKYGIKELLAEGKSKFTGSASSRIHNLALAAERAGNTLLAPGAIYSLNKTIGEISAKTGYDSAYIISNGRTVLGEGGGVCQTSTTIFRAALNAGLPIVARYPHAYRVKYYEIESPVGIDAAIYQPSLDFQFKNDTANYILVESTLDLKENSLVFKIYGTSDNRKVEITEPVVTSQTAPPPALYVDDPTLAEGTIKQVDFPAWGANVSFSRTVTRDGETMYKDMFNSRYQAWKAVYMRGTKK